MRIFTKLVEEFYLNIVHADGVLVTKVKDQILKIDVVELCHHLEFGSQGITSFNEIDMKEGMKLMVYKKNPQLKGVKKKEFPQEYEFLADIIGKYILCKDSAHDSISELQLKIMIAIAMKMKITSTSSS